MDEKQIAKIVKGVHDGSLADSLQRKYKYVSSGFLIGASAGIIIASILKKGKFGAAAMGGLIGGTIGYMGRNVKLKK